MAIEPKNLNQSNKGYGEKSAPSSWQSNLNLLAGIRTSYQNGAYQEVIDESLSSLKGHSITSLKNLDILHEGDLARLYYVGMAYRKRGQDTLAVPPLQIVYSQLGFVSHMLDPFPQYVALAKKELESIAKEHGEDFVNSCDVDSFFAKEVSKASSNCFIATAACGDPWAPEVTVLSTFRDDRLSRSRLGRAFIQFYYAVSPPLAAVIARSDTLRRAALGLVVRPLARLVHNRIDNKAVPSPPKGAIIGRGDWRHLR